MGAVDQTARDRIAELEGELIVLRADIESARQSSNVLITKLRGQVQSLKDENESLKGRLGLALEIAKEGES